MTGKLILALALSVFAMPVLAQTTSETVEELASEEETTRVRETSARINCQAAQIEKESDDLFEIDDVDCEIGQYDIKLDGEYNIRSMTRDE